MKDPATEGSLMHDGRIRPHTFHVHADTRPRETPTR